MRKPLRLRTALSLVAFSTLLVADAQNVGINTSGAAPDAKAILDVDVSALGTKKGMLIPRMTRAERLALTSGAPLGVADRGLWVYQTDDASPYDPKEAHGFFIFDGSAWGRIGHGRSAWNLTGNGNVTASNLLGTLSTSPTLGKPFALRSVNPQTPAPQLFIAGDVTTTGGMVGLNNATPVERLDVGGGIRVSGTSLGNSEGDIVYGSNGATPAYNWHYGNIDGTANGWRRMENAEVFVPATPNNYPKDTLACPSTPVTGSVTRGVIGGPSTNLVPFRTAFTETVSFDRGFRSQIIYRSDELTAAGLCPGIITAIAFNALSNENTAAQIRITLRMWNTSLNQFGSSWDDNAQTPASIVFAPSNVLIATGAVVFNFTTPFNWTGGNIVLDVSGTRAAGANGLNPSVSSEVTSYPSIRYFNVSNGAQNIPLTGDNIDDNPLTPSPPLSASNFTNGTQRPVTTFTGNVKATTYVNGSAPYILYSGAVMVDSMADPLNTWAATNFRGPGTIRARLAAFDGTTRLSDHVFDRYFDGAVRPEDQQAAQNYDYVGLPQLKEYLATERHLPNMPSRTEWERHGARSIGELQTGLWETVETQALHIIELEKDLGALEALAFDDKDLDADKAQALIADIQGSARLTEQQKLHLTNAVRARITPNMPGK